MRAFKTVEAGDFEHTVLYHKHDEFAFLFDAFNSMIEQIRFLISEVYVQKINRQKSELKQLQYQINPHFLYNSLASLHRMIKFNDEEGAAAMTRYLSEHYQYITRTGTDAVPLSKEYEHTQRYIEIQKMRFPKIGDIFISKLPAVFANLLVPRLILQPIIENAFHYGLSENGAGGIIEIRFAQNEEFFIISVCDNSGRMNEKLIRDMEQKLSGQNTGEADTGLVNVHKRLLLQFGENSGFKLSVNEWGGLCCSLYLKVV